MSSPTARAPALAQRVVQWLVFLAGSAELIRLTLHASGGRAQLWAFNHMDEARFTSMAMLTGTLRFRNGIAAMTNDDQIYNGAAYTNWGFGVPVLQLPFQALARRFPSTFPTGFFPDRAIFFFYAACLVPVLWWTLDRLLAGRGEEGGPLARAGRAACSFGAAGLVLVYALYQLTAYRFFLYEETIAYLVVAELFALCAYVHLRRSNGLGPVVALAVAAGVGLLIRPTGLGYLGVWALLLGLACPRKVPLAVFAAASAPFVAFWLYSNHVRSGSALSFGFNNSVPWFPFHLPMMRWGSHCSDSVDHFSTMAKLLFDAFFVSFPEIKDPHIVACHYSIELQESSMYAAEPFFGIGVLVALGLVLLHHVVRREKSVGVYLPFAALAFLFCNFARTGIGFGWRYIGDFWPLLVLVGVQYVDGLSSRAYRLFGWRMALVMLAFAFAGYRKHITTVLPTLRPLEPVAVASLKERFDAARWGVDPPLPSLVKCHDAVAWPYRGGTGWTGACGVDTFTHLYLGVPKKPDAHYELRIETEEMSARSIRVYVNGRDYTAQKDGGAYRTQVDIDYAALSAPAVMITVEWTTAFTPPTGGKLVSIELV